MEIFQYAFMRSALLVGFLLSLTMPCIGVVVVLKRQSMIGDALAHSSLAGVAAGMMIGINPIVGSLLACIIAAFGIEAIGKRFPQYKELSIAIILSTGVGLAGLLSRFLPGSMNLNSFLFGSIVAISSLELNLVIGVSALVLLSFILLYRELFLCSFNERTARLTGVRVKLVDAIFTLLTALTVAVASRTVGTLIVSSLLVLPVACAMQFSHSYLQTVILSTLFGMAFTMSGLLISTFAGWPSGATIVLLSVAVLLLCFPIKAILTHRAKSKAQQNATNS